MRRSDHSALTVAWRCLASTCRISGSAQLRDEVSRTQDFTSEDTRECPHTYGQTLDELRRYGVSATDAFRSWAGPELAASKTPRRFVQVWRRPRSAQASRQALRA